MSLELTYPHVEKIDGEPARLQRFPRVRVAQLATEYLAYGWSVDEMCRQHPHLIPAEVHAAMGYYFDHQDEIESEIRAELDDFDAAHRAAANSSLRLKLRARGAR
jgi:hypothetical protein